MKPSCLWFLITAMGAGSAINARSDPGDLSPAPARWTNGLPRDPDFFPIGVWLQDPRNAPRFKAAGINLYVGLWRGPTPDQLTALRRAGMSVICDQNSTGLTNPDNRVIVGWMHGDEPDNAQARETGDGYGPPILPATLVRDYERIRAADSSRPVLLNLGQGVAWDDYIGRGVRRNHPEDYPEYLRGCDVASFDIYPVVHDSPEVAGRLEFVAGGVERLVQWTRQEKPVWSCIECTHIANPNTRATPAQVRSEVWMALIRGARGIIYFVHQFKPAFREAALLDDPEMLAAVTAINRQVRDLAPVLNSPDVREGASVKSSVADVPIAWRLKRHGGDVFLFAVNLRNQPVSGSFTVSGISGDAAIEVLGEARSLAAKQGKFADDFSPYAVHLYRVRATE